MASEGAEEFIVKQIEAGDKLTGLSLGHEDFAPLKAFLKREAHAFERQSLARTYAVYRGEPQKFVAYMTLVCGEVVIGDGDAPPVDDDEVPFRYKHFPAVKIARLAVHKNLQGSGLGRQLVELALGIAKGTICPAVGCRFMVVDSKTRSVGFYSKCGFTILNTAANKGRSEPIMYIDLGKVATFDDVQDALEGQT